MSNAEQFATHVRSIKGEEADLCISKNQDYGPYNIARAPGGAINGLAVRLHDKIARLAHLLETGADPQHESVKDTFRDIANYGTIGTMVIEGLWPGTDDSTPVALETFEPEPHTGDRVEVIGGPPDLIGHEGTVVGRSPIVSIPWKVSLDAFGGTYNLKRDEFEIIS